MPATADLLKFLQRIIYAGTGKSWEGADSWIWDRVAGGWAGGGVEADFQIT
jgi:hypothetical protein